MQKEIHPKYNKITATCACGASFTTGSTQDEIRVDVCSHCHPLFTGQQKILDAEGRVERFKKRYAKTATTKKSKKKS
ncbi:50S ribosomal protein L31 [Candidatus Margulisiibacteriota bacterium]